jgi:glycosyltransferase involved in cell wall biosynthesis
VRGRPRVSIGVPVFNGERFLEETVLSLLGQTYTDFEIVISDNASTDRTGELARDLAARDKRVHYTRNARNFGAVYNYRHAFDLSAGEYFKWAAADDLYRPEYLARCVEVLDSDPSAVLAHTQTMFIDEDGRALDIADPGWDLRSPDAGERLRYVIGAGHWVNIIFGVIRRAALARTRFLGSYPKGDYRLLGDLAVLGKFIELPERAFLRRLHREASSAHAADVAWHVAFYTGVPRAWSLPLWFRMLDHCRTIAGAPLPPRVKLSVLRSLLRHMVAGRRELGDELRLVGRHAIRKILPVTPRPGRRQTIQPR